MGCCTTADGQIFWSGDGMDACIYCGGCADYLCDYPLGQGRTCDAMLCRRHAVDQARASVRLDYCPPHDALAKSLELPTWTERRDAVLRACLAQKVEGRRYAVFHLIEKNDPIDPQPFMPNGFTECSGFCVTDRGAVHSFWFGWDGRRPALTEWEDVTGDDQSWRHSKEYRAARRRVIGLGVINRRPTRRARRFVPA